MSLACEAEVKVENELAVRFSIVSRPVPHLEYIRTISSLIGASHILAIFEEVDSIKIYFDDKRYVDTLIRSGIHVLGRHVRIDYVVPPGTKVMLSNVDPVITNTEIIKVLSAYGTIVSPIVRPPISDDAELCHIAYGVRYVYMNLTETLPNKIEFKSGDTIHSMSARIDNFPVLYAIPYLKTDDSDSYYEDNHIIGDSPPSLSEAADNTEGNLPLVVNVETDAGASKLKIASTKSLKRNYKSRPGRPKKDIYNVKRKGITPTSQAAGKIIKKNAKHKFMAIKVRHFKRVKRGGSRKKKMPVEIKPNDLENVAIQSSSESPDLAAVNGEDLNETLNGPFEPVLEKPMLVMFLEEVKRQRAPFEVVKKYLGDSCSSDTVHILCQQLMEYNREIRDVNLRTRIFRLIRTLKESIIASVKTPEP